MKNSSHLIWNPVHTYIEERICENQQVRFLISPFIKLAALKRLIELCDDLSQLKVVARWDKSDLISGASDLDIYPFLKELKIPLFIHPHIHLKLFVFDDQWAFHTSGNITKKGLGLSYKHNIEIGVHVSLNHDDWKNIYSLLEESRRVDDDLYAKAKKYVDEHARDQPKLPPLKIHEVDSKPFSRLSLPASDHPDILFTFYKDNSAKQSPVASHMHDMLLYHIPPNLDRDDFFDHLRDRFTNQPFIIALATFIREAEDARRFGEVTAWLQDNCTDRPTPYRWELKEVTARLYDWLEYFFDEISWNIPGQRSQVIRWSEPRD